MTERDGEKEIRRRLAQAEARIEEARRRVESSLERAHERVEAAMDRARRQIDAAHRRHLQMIERARPNGQGKKWTWNRRRPPERGEAVPAVPSPKPLPLSGGAEAPLD